MNRDPEVIDWVIIALLGVVCVTLTFLVHWGCL